MSTEEGAEHHGYVGVSKAMLCCTSITIATVTVCAISMFLSVRYMAPEMVVMLYQRSKNKEGYSISVDWWSLGVTMYRLITSGRPFSVTKIANFTKIAKSGAGAKYTAAASHAELAMLFEPVSFPDYLSAESVDIMKAFLDVNEKTRLGSNGPQQIFDHPFFHGIDWNRMESKLLVPPFFPDDVLLDESPAYENFDSMMNALGKESWLQETFDPDCQTMFLNWNYTSPQALRLEMGIANANDQYEAKLKVQKLLGPR